MKNISIVILAVSLLMIASCKKETLVSGGSWTFKGTTYNVTSGIASGVYTPTEIDDSFITQSNGVDTVIYETYENVFKTLTLVSSGSNSYSHIVFTFWDLPTSNGQYTFTTSLLPDSGSTQIGVDMRITTGSTYAGNTYVPKSNTVNADVTVNNGMIKVAFQGLEMVNVNDTSDHEILSGTVNQTQK